MSMDRLNNFGNRDAIPRLNSALPGIVWPAIPGPSAAVALALQYQLNETQWWPAEKMLAMQLRQLDELLRFAVQNILFYRDWLLGAGYDPNRPLTMSAWRQLPIIDRRKIQELGEAVNAATVPKAHYPLRKDSTSGSTGTPLRVTKTAASRVVWEGFALRDQIWHRRDFSLKQGAIRRDRHGRADYPHGAETPVWGGVTSRVFKTGPAVLLDIRTSVSQQVEWLTRQAPAYLLTFPSNLALILLHCAEKGISISGLEEIRTFGEVLSPDVREMCRKILGVPIVDAYSGVELGYLALQCPESENLHIQSEGALVEVLDDDNRPCEPNTVGRVVVTPLHNFAMPLIRYANGDYAETGDACSCGRTLPVLRQVLGRARNFVTFPSGERRYAYFGAKLISKIEAIIQFQIIQRTLHLLEVKIVARQALNEVEENGLKSAIGTAIGYPFDINITYHESIPRTAGGKFEDFMSEVT